MTETMAEAHELAFAAAAEFIATHGIVGTMDGAIGAALAAAWPVVERSTPVVAPDPALGRCQALLQCHRETGHDGGHEAREKNTDA